MIHPDLGRGINVNKVLTLGRTVQLQVPDDNVARFADLETAVGQARVAAHAEDGGVAEDFDDVAAGERAGDLDYTADLCCGGERGAGGHCGAGAASTTCRAGGEANELVNLGSALLEGRGVC